MDQSDMARQLAKLISDILHESVDPDSLTARLVEDDGANSMDTVDMVERVERRFGVKIDNDELSSLVTFGDVLAIVLKRLPADAGTVGNAGVQNIHHDESGKPTMTPNP